MYVLFMTQQFKDDLDRLDKVIKEQVVKKTIRQIARDPDIRGLNTKKQFTIRKRKIQRSRVNQSYRLLWEWVENAIYLWRVGSHDFIDAIDTVSGAQGARGEYIYYDKVVDDGLHEWRKELNQRRPFDNFPENILRLLGVPEEQLRAVKSIADAEEIWDLQLPQHVQSTLLDILTMPDWTVENLLDTRQLLYRATVDQLEGYCEGKIKDLLLKLTDEQMEYVEANATGPILIKGVAGSGKTTIGLYRAQYLAERIAKAREMFVEETSILLLTYTNTLVDALEQLYIEKFGEVPAEITISTYLR